ncbi:cell envelope biogenesis protein OmpA [Flaviramulus sp. BrNp1-15]|uniref:outer membrane beta-barrel protein n=1 Tax=Flaviramulus sp. BrNp1-15 TaxID=2916754 RepID=UPI001EE8F599|nr:outer membrane beta-barrel protein [Flaviramulus sp. BrNp1-15]ULC60096.1 cell envelope biogenesis protein OmpA [Flaviramulus sp. BrNp1-15]
MSSIFKIYKKLFITVIFTSYGVLSFSQGDTSTVKAQFALGLNNPSRDGFVQGFEGQIYNFPTVNLGVQYMFTPKLGAKLDYGFSRISNQEYAQDFKLNYSRINLQVVYNATSIFSFLPQRMGTFIHAGPGFSILKPLGNFTQNETSYLNTMGGIEFHYGISDKLSLYLDASYILGFEDDFIPISNGFGSFNGNLLTVTIGASISLSGCYYCEQND